MTTLSSEWDRKPLSELVDTRKRVKPADFPNHPYVGMEHVEAHSMRLLGTVPASTMKSTAVHFMPGDILYGRLRPYLNKVWLAEFEGLGSPEFIAMRPEPEIRGRFLQYFLNQPMFVRFATNLNTGDRPRVDFEQIKTFSVPVPPLSAQDATVREIDKQFARADSASSAIWDAKRKARVFDRAAYQAAAMGAVFELDVAASGGVCYPPGWKTASLGELSIPKEGLITGPFGTLLRKSDHREEGVPVVGIPNISDRGFRAGGWFYLEMKKAEDLKRYWLRQGDLLVSRSGTVGEVCVMPAAPKLAVMSTNLMRIRLENASLSNWVSISIRGSRVVRGQLSKLLGGSTRNFLNLKILSQLIIGIPPESERVELEMRLARNLSQSDYLVKSLGSFEERAKAFRRELLTAGFAGTLSITP